MFARIAVLAVALLLLARPAFTQGATSENNDRLKQALERFPAADGNQDGVLTQDEARAFMQKRRGAQNQKQPNQQQNPAAAQMLKLHEARTFKGLPYRLMKPIDLADNPDKAYPLILSLHGAAGRGSDNEKSLRNWNQVMAEEARRRKHPCFVVVPQTENPWQVPGSAPELTDEKLAALPDAWQKMIERRRERGMDSKKGDLGKVFELLDALAQEFKIDKRRVYVLGHSMGGFGSWNAICEQPERFAAAIPSAGGCPPWVDVKRIADVPIWTFHGDADKTVPVALTRHVFGELKKAGANAKYTEMQGVGHNVNSFAFVYAGDDKARGYVTQYASDRCDRNPDVWDWLFAQKKKDAK